MPARGGPVRQAKETKVKTIPSLTPVLVMSSVNTVTVDGKTDWMPAATIPLNTEKTYKPQIELTAAQQYMQIAQLKLNGTTSSLFRRNRRQRRLG